MIVPGSTYVVMGLLDADSIAYAVGTRLQALGAKVIYTVLNERFKRIFLDRSKNLTEEEKAAITTMYCDVTVEEEVKALFAATGPIAGVVHSIAYTNPKTGLGEEFHTSAVDDLKLAYHISAVSLATVTRYAQPQMPQGGSVVCMSFSSQLAFAYYNWMGVNKAALEAVVRGLARRHGRDLVRVNAISAGPLATKAATSIPGFGELARCWQECSPLPWDLVEDKNAVADAVIFLLSGWSRKISGQVLHVDGGASAVGGRMLPYELAPQPPPPSDASAAL